MRVRILLFLFCFFVTFAYSQTREYYKKDGIISSKAMNRGINYQCSIIGNRLVELSDVNVRKAVTFKIPTKKPEPGFVGV